MNNQSTISKDEKGLNENIAIDASSNDLVVNSVKETLVRYYIVDKVEVFLLIINLTDLTLELKSLKIT